MKYGLCLGIMALFNDEVVSYAILIVMTLMFMVDIVKAGCKQ